MPAFEAPSVELGSAPQTPSIVASPSPSEISSASSPEPPNIRATPLFRALAMPPPEPAQPPGQEELERRLPGYRRIIIPRELTLIELLILSINRCGLSSLDGVWGLGNLRELYAAGNRIQDLQPLAALQKLHTLNLADALRKLTLTGTPASDDVDYRSRVAAALPMLVYLDDRPLHTDVTYSDEEFGSATSSESEDEEEPDLLAKLSIPPSIEAQPSTSQDESYLQPVPSESSTTPQPTPISDSIGLQSSPLQDFSGVSEPDVSDNNIVTQDVNTSTDNIADDEWLCSGSKLTSLDAVCGNLANSLRRNSSTYQRRFKDAQKELVEQTIEDASRAVAAEIPRAPRLEDWIKFKEETGIDIEINFNDRPKCPDPTKILERLEKIEKETQERIKEETLKGKSKITDGNISSTASTSYLPNSSSTFDTMSSINNYEMFHTDLVDLPAETNIDTFHDDIDDLHSVSRERVGFPDNNGSLTD
ncbi:hypothetical protein HF086_011639 [Spodoptera exigua]|uniref:Uncharacterized protein n=1 Tax=Spodoptera exigua TaxID=7107 RepID=A0A922MSK8_SPOEX|nr:hypothetical protein HF086_011639 [Spodoptera exigua]